MELKKNATGKRDSGLKDSDLEKLENEVVMGFERTRQKELSILSTSMKTVLGILNNSNFLQSDDPEYQMLKWNLSNSLQVSLMELRALYRLSSSKRTAPLKSYTSIGD